MALCDDYGKNVEIMRNRLRVDENFDCIEKHLKIGEGEVCFFYLDGFIKDGDLQRIMQYLLSQKNLPDADTTEMLLPYVEVSVCQSEEDVVGAVLSGQSAMLSQSFGDKVILLDARSYPARTTSEPDTDRVMQGAHDGFVETLVFNTALLRRRIRDTRLTMKYHNMGGSGRTDVVICYMQGVADERTVRKVIERVEQTKPRSLTLGYRSLSESLIKKGWLNPFPKVRITERPDAAAAQVLEGSILILCDTSPQAMIIPTSIFDYLQQTDDFYFPPLTGTYLRLVRTLILLLSMVLTPLWYLCVKHAHTLPEYLLFLIPDNPGALPIIAQLLLAEIALDGLKIASMNTPDSLTNSLSIVGALILGDFAVGVGWLCADVILYMAFVAIANFAQQNNELGYALKFVRVMTLILVYFFDVWGFLIAFLALVLMLVTNKGVTGEGYLYPLVPFNFKALMRLIFRFKKGDE